MTKISYLINLEESIVRLSPAITPEAARVQEETVAEGIEEEEEGPGIRRTMSTSMIQIDNRTIKGLKIETKSITLICSAESIYLSVYYN